MRRRSTTLGLFLLLGLFVFCTGCAKSGTDDGATDGGDAATPPPATQADG